MKSAPPSIPCLLRFTIVATALFLGACAHPITISPKSLEFAEAPAIDKSVAYVISQGDRDLEVTTDGGGGDKVRYFPYRDLETGIYQVLSSVFSKVTLTRALNDEAAISKNNVLLQMVPRITTTSSSDGLFTWPPTQFAVTIEYRFLDREGKVIHQNLVLGQGRATFSEFTAAGDFALAGRRASEDVLRKLRDQLLGAKSLR